MSIIRAAGLRDLPGVYAVCFETADPDRDPVHYAGNRDLLGHVYAGPYLVAEPEAGFARVVADEHGVAGYLFGCPDTAAFEAWAEREWWPPLRAQYPLGSGHPADAEMIARLHRPPTAPRAIAAAYPAHLHIDLLPRARGHGHGRSLIDGLCRELAAQGIAGVHLGVGSDNRNAIRFYEHLGFTALDDDGDTLWMAKRL